MYRATITKILLLSLIYYAEGKSCKTIEGIWYNQFGSEVKISLQDDRTVVGHYKTAVRRFPYAKPVEVVIRGAAATRNGDAVFAFSAIWNDGDSVTTWAGQCLECNGIEMLHTDWVLWSSSAEKDCRSNRKTLVVGEDTFTRTKVPSSYRQAPPHASKPSEIHNSEEDRIPTAPGCHLFGNWSGHFNLSIWPDSSDFTLGYFEADMPVLDTMVEVRTQIHGLQKNGSFGTTVTFQDENVVVALVGQCNQCSKGNRIIKTSWMKRTQIKDCKVLYRATRYGEFTIPRR